MESVGAAGLASDRAVAGWDRGWITVAPDGGVWRHGDGDDDGADDDRGGHRAGEVDLGLLDEPDPERRNVHGHERTLAVHTDGTGRFVALVNDYGRTGLVVDLVTGTITLRFDRQAHRPEQTRYPLAFVAPAGRGPVVVAATDWNRVDAFDPATGELLTPRQVPSEHHLDYFHGALQVSPDGRWMLDDGWVWQPSGIPTAWSLERWLGGNVGETENGPSLTAFCQRGYLWDAPLCWIDERRVAIWGLGDDDEDIRDGVTVYDVEDVAVVAELVGVPRGLLWSDGERLFAGGEGGLTAWDPVTGERTAHHPDLQPIAVNRRLGELLVPAVVEPEKETDGDVSRGRLRRVRLDGATGR